MNSAVEVNPVPPWLGDSVPLIVKVPVLVIGPPLNEKPVVPGSIATERNEPAEEVVQDTEDPLVVRIFPLFPD
jgi:hypothetical protein